MAFPTNPNDGDLYTTSLGIIYQYELAHDRWLLYSHTIVGETGIQGETGIRGDTGFKGDTGIQGIGYTGLSGETGLQGIQGETGTQGHTGVIGTDPTFNSVTITGNSNGTSQKVPGLLYGTGTPPSPSGIPYGTIYIQYVS